MYLNPNPNLKELAKRVFDYNGQKFQVEAAETVKIVSYWDEGSRKYYALVQSDGTCEKFGDAGGPFGPASINLIVAPDSMVLVNSIVGGKEYGVTFIVHPSVFPKYLNPAQDELPWAERVVLTATRSLKAYYAGDGNVRFHEAHRQTGITQSQWTDAKWSLIEKRLLNKAGAITPDGRNAAGSKQLFDLKP